MFIADTILSFNIYRYQSNMIKKYGVLVEVIAVLAIAPDLYEAGAITEAIAIVWLLWELLNGIGIEFGEVFQQ